MSVISFQMFSTKCKINNLYYLKDCVESCFLKILWLRNKFESTTVKALSYTSTVVMLILNLNSCQI